MVGSMAECKSSGSGAWLWVLIAIIVIGSFFLLLPVYREYGKRCDEYERIQAEHAALQAELLEKQRQVNRLEKSPAAVEDVARRDFNQGAPGETTLISVTPESKKK